MRSRVNVDDQGPEFPKESSVEMRCLDAFAAVSHFERTHCLALQVQPSFCCSLHCLLEGGLGKRD